MIDTLLAGRTGFTAAYLVGGDRPAIVDPGARTSAQAVRDALAALGVGREDLGWIVLTHVHLDHCGSTGILAAAFPRAQIVVHARGARHLAEPARLVAGTVAIHRHRWSLYGGLDATPAARIVAAGDGHRVDLGAGRALTMLATPGHARHHMSVLDETTGTVVAGDAVGVRMGEGGVHPALPPPEVDLEAGDRSLRRLAAIDPAVLCLSHFGPVPDAGEAIATARRQLARAGEVALRHPDRADLVVAFGEALPLRGAVTDAAGRERWRLVGWDEATVDGLAGWAARQQMRGERPRQ